MKSNTARSDSYTILEHHRETVNQCFRCGLCRSVCPSFEEIGLESASPRGRVQYASALLDGKLGLEQAFQDRMLDCLNCMRCGETCPSGVRTDRIVLAARAEMVRRGKLNIVKKFAFNTVLRSRFLFRIATWLASFGQNRFYNGNRILEALVPKLAGMGDKNYPKFARKPALSRLPRLNRAQGAPVMRAGYFIGCATNLLFPEVAEATVRVLTRNGIEVLIPGGQVCCGIPVYSSGDFSNARRLAEKNLAVFRDSAVDCIITDCSSCSAALKNELHELLGVARFDVPVYDLTEFLANHITLSKEMGPVNARVTYHDPCHLKRGQGISREPRDIIRMIPGIEFTEMQGSDTCCGGAGTFSFTHHDLSRKVGARKHDAIRATGADYVATPCPSCKMQLDDLLAHEGSSVTTVHPVQLLDNAYTQKEKNVP